MNILDYLVKNRIIFDGAMGTMLQSAGLPVSECPEVYNITRPEAVLAVHEAYVKAGADAVTTNTFQANALNLKDSGFSTEEIVGKGVELARRSGAGFVVFGTGPTGRLLAPYGDFTFEEAYELYKLPIVAAAKAGADAVLIETLSTIDEARACILAARENTALPVFVTLTYEAGGRTFMGVDPAAAAAELTGAGADVIGANCSLGAAELLPVIEIILKNTHLPVMAQPNAGLPKTVDGRVVYDVTPREFASYMKELADMGVRLLGGCCGTTPEFIKAVRDVLRDKTHATQSEKGEGTDNV